MERCITTSIQLNRLTEHLFVVKKINLFECTLICMNSQKENAKKQVDKHYTYCNLLQVYVEQF